MPEDTSSEATSDLKFLETINPVTPIVASDVLPSTGERDSQYFLMLGALALLSGQGFIFYDKRKREE